MRPFVLAATLCLALAVNGLAQGTSADSPATKEDVEKYLQAVHSHDMMQQMLDAMSKPMQQMVHDQFMKDKDRLPPDFETRMNKMISDQFKDMPFDEMTQAMVPAYQKHFTRGDMDALVAFYSSATGQKLLREMPAITAEAMQSMMPIMRQHMEAVNQRVQQDLADMLKNSPPRSGQSVPDTQK
jgi:hypothetical protein